jgi:hypothetical protein
VYGDRYQSVEPIAGPKVDQDTVRREVRRLADSCLPVETTTKPVARHVACLNSRCALVEGPPSPGSQGGGSYRKPAVADKGCVARTIRIPSSERRVNQTLVVKFVVTAEGKPIMFEIPVGKPSPAIIRAIITGILSCTWLPGADGNGKAASIWVVQPVRFE